MSLFSKYKSVVSIILAVQVTKDNLEDLSKELPGSTVADGRVYFENLLHKSYHNAGEGEWICKTEQEGDYYPCKHEVFAKRYYKAPDKNIVTKNEHPLLHCNFCGDRQDKVNHLIAGPGVYICDDCIELCAKLIEEYKSKENSKQGEV